MSRADWVCVVCLILMYICGYLEGARDERTHTPRPSNRPPD